MIAPQTHAAPSSPIARTNASSDSTLITVIIPVYNEVATIGTLLTRVAHAPYAKQVIVVDDGSRDATAAAIEQARAEQCGLNCLVELVSHRTNCGKGAAIRTGLASARGAVTIIQDADLECDPAEYPRLVEPILAGDADVVFGSRYLLRNNHLPWTANRLCVHLLNAMVRVLYGQRLTDEATCYKVFRTDVLQRMDLKCQRFEFCPEVTAKACRMGIRIHEVPVSYRPRTSEEGKKIGWWDGVEAITALIYWRFAPLEPLVTAQRRGAEPVMTQRGQVDSHDKGRPFRSS